jgi:hypothetical protein
VRTDEFDMAVAHRGFRSELRNAPGLVRDVAAGDTTRSAIVGGHLDFIMTALHHHHRAEDASIWPKLHARAPERAAEVGRMEEAHHAITVVAERVQSALARWAQSGDATLARQFLPTLAELSSRVDEHLDDEERNVVPLIAEYLSAKEWRKFLARGSAFLIPHPKLGLVLAGFTLVDLPSERRDRFLSQVPLPARKAYLLLGNRVFTGYRAKVYG